MGLDLMKSINRITSSIKTTPENRQREENLHQKVRVTYLANIRLEFFFFSF